METSFFKRTTLGGYLLTGLLVLSLVYCAGLLADLVLHPLAPGVSFQGTAAVAERWIAGLIGILEIAIGILIVRRVRGNPVGPLLIVYAIGTVAWTTREDLGSPAWTAITHLALNFYFGGVAFPALAILLVSFPTGRVYPRQAVPWAALFVVLMAAGTLAALVAQTPGANNMAGADLPQNPILVPALVRYYSLIEGPILEAAILLGIGVAAISLTLRYRSASIYERQQIKWLVWVTGVFMALVLVYLPLFARTSDRTLTSPLAIAAVTLFYGLINSFPAVGIGLGILRSRLWDIDVIIRRTLIYSMLTATLAGFYFGSVVVLQQIIRRITGESSSLAIIISTLAIAVLFQPLRRRIQAIIDRRFYRSKYDAAQTLTQFGISLVNETDLARLSERLVAVVEETMQPDQVWLWVRPTGREKTANAQQFQGPASA